MCIRDRAEYGGVDVLALFANHHLLQHRLRPDSIAHPQARGEHLGEAAGVQHQAVLIQRFDRWDILSFEPQLAVGIVLQDQHTLSLIHI